MKLSNETYEYVSRVSKVGNPLVVTRRLPFQYLLHQGVGKCATPFSGLLPFTLDTLYCWVLSKEVSSTIFKVFGRTRPGIEPRSPGPLVNTLPTRPMNRLKNNSIPDIYTFYFWLHWCCNFIFHYKVKFVLEIINGTYLKVILLMVGWFGSMSTLVRLFNAKVTFF